jgi:repressor LexA
MFMARASAKNLAKPALHLYPPCAICQFMKEEIPNRIREIRKAKKVSQEDLAARVSAEIGEDVDPSTIGRLENGRMELTHRWIYRIAKALGVTESEIIQPAGVPIKLVPILGSVPAGPLEEAIESPEGWWPVPANFGGPRVFGLRPKGDSMEMVATDEDIVLFDPDDIDLVPGRAYVVRNGEGHVTFKRYENDPPRLEPDSNNPDHRPILIGREPFLIVARAIYATREL